MVALILLALLAAACWIALNLRRGDIVLLPKGFEGWVVIRYKVTGRPMLAHEGVRNLIRVPVSGEFSTSSTRATGYGVDTYYFVGADGKRQRLPTEAEDCQRQEVCIRQFQLFSSPSAATRFFVGNREDLSRLPEAGGPGFE